MQEYVILVDEKDNEKGKEEKMKAHEKGLLHRAFSIFIFNSEGLMLLQKRALHKYHSAGLWSNACCSHPMPKEETINAAHRRLKQELGFDTQLEKKFSFIYKADVGNDLIEHEFDHVFFGVYNGKIKINTEEVAETRWINKKKLLEEIRKKPEQFTAWFKIAIKEIQKKALI